MKIEAIINPR